MVSGRLSRLTASGDTATGTRAGPDQRLVPAVPQPLGRRPALRPRRRAVRQRRRRARASTTPTTARRARPRTRAATRRRRGGHRRRRRPRRAARCAPGPAHDRATRRRSTARSCASIPARAPALPGNPLAGSLGRQRPPDHRLRLPQPVPLHLPPRHQRDLGRRRGLEHLGGDRPRSPPRPSGRRTSAGPATRAPGASPRYDAAGPRPSARTSTPRRARSPRRTTPTTTPPRSSPARPARPGSSSITGLAFYTGAAPTRRPTRARCSSPTTRADCIWVMPRGRQRAARPHAVTDVRAGAASPVDLEIGPGGDLFYVDLNGGDDPPHRSTRPATSRRRPSPRRRRPAAPLPLTVAFDATRLQRSRPGRHADLRLGPRRRRRLRRQHRREAELHLHHRRRATRSG